MVSRTVRAVELVEEYEGVFKERKVALLLGESVEGLRDTLKEEVGECVCIK